MATTITCTADSGSATGCTPLCDRPAVALIGTPGFDTRRGVCRPHLGYEHGRAYPTVLVVTTLDGRPADRNGRAA